MTLVFDLDDTICIHKNRDYVNARPIQETITKMQQLKSLGYKIIIYTARGMNSCAGNLEKIKLNNEAVVLDWLKRHNVPCDELIFGKPLGDWYVDDKALSLEDFLNMDFSVLKGGSGAIIRKEGNRVIKTGISTKMQYDWFLVARDNNINIPEILGFTVDTLYMGFVPGDNLNLHPERIHDVIQLVDKMSKIQYDDLNADLKLYCENILKHSREDFVLDICDEILKNSEELITYKSFCHGDLTLSNCILYNNNIVIIDPNFKADYNSYLLDYAKLRMSLNGFEQIYCLKNDNLINEYKNALEILDNKLIELGILKLVKLLEISYWIRLCNYRQGIEKEFALNKAKILWEDYLHAKEI